jgi:hypothetical protein
MRPPRCLVPGTWRVAVAPSKQAVGGGLDGQLAHGAEALVDRGQRTVQGFKKCAMRLEERTRERRALLGPRTPQPLDERREANLYVVRSRASDVPTS